MLIGMGKPYMNFPISSAAFREVDILGVFRYCNTYPRAIQIMKDRSIPGLKRMLTHRFDGLANGAKALDMASRMRDGGGNIVVKVVVDANNDDVEV